MSKVSRQAIAAHMEATDQRFVEAVMDLAFKSHPHLLPEGKVGTYGFPVTLREVEQDHIYWRHSRGTLAYTKGIQMSADQSPVYGGRAFVRRVMFDKDGYLDLAKIRAKFAEVLQVSEKTAADRRERRERLNANAKRRDAVINKYTDLKTLDIRIGDKVDELLDDSGQPYALVREVRLKDVSEIALQQIIEIMERDREDQKGREVTT